MKKVLGLDLGTASIGWALVNEAENNDDILRNITWKNIRTPNNLKGVVKVSINHIGHIVHIGE